MSIPFSSVLYYPTIEINDEQWLRNAVLFWDKIYTIVPESYRDPWRIDFAKEVYEMGMVDQLRISPGMKEVEELTEIVEDFITNPTTADLRISNISYRKRIYNDKLPYMLHNYLAGNLKSWTHLPKKFFHSYMTFLAINLAQERGYGLITNSNTAQQLSIAVEKGEPVRSRDPRVQTTSKMLFDLSVKTIKLPETLTAEQVMKFKKDHSEELGIFRRKVAQLVSDIPVDAPVEALQQHVSDIYSGIRPTIRSLEQATSEWRCLGSGLRGFFRIYAFTKPLEDWAKLAGMPPFVTSIARTGISLLLAPVQVYRKQKEVRSNSPYSYLLSLRGLKQRLQSATPAPVVAGW